MYLIRIELHSATYDNYVTLHAEMAKRAFSRTVKGDNGLVYNLPTAEYHYSGSRTIEQVLQSAVDAANATGKASGVIVADAKQLQWQGLAAT
jgi:hypothetical protein